MAVTFVSEAGEETDISWRQLDDRSTQVGRALAAAGVGPGDPVAMTASPLFPALSLVCLLNLLISPFQGTDFRIFCRLCCNSSSLEAIWFFFSKSSASNFFA